jgi:putative NADPH-quinone reductase
MRASVILAHPNKESFNHAIAKTAIAALQENGHEVVFHDLYREGFDPILPCSELVREAALTPDVEAHCREISSSDGIIIVHPNWWGQPPAILKGWVDRVLRPDVAYRFLEGDQGDGVPLGLLNAKTALVFNTSNTPSGREIDVFGDPLETLWKNCVFALCGVGVFHRRMFRIVITSTAEQRSKWLEEVWSVKGRCFPPAWQEPQEVS